MSDHSGESGRRDETAQVLRFRPRTSASAPSRHAAPAKAVEDTHTEAPDDFRHRMLVNAAGLFCAIALTASGIWLASRMSELRETQDCVLSGRRNCAPIAAVDRQSLPLRQH